MFEKIFPYICRNLVVFVVFGETKISFKTSLLKSSMPVVANLEMNRRVHLKIANNPHETILFQIKSYFINNTIL